MDSVALLNNGGSAATQLSAMKKAMAVQENAAIQALQGAVGANGTSVQAPSQDASKLASSVTGIGQNIDIKA